MQEDWTDYLKIILFLLFVLGGLIFLGSCDSGWSISGYEV
jgi:hypothetical protein